MKKNNENALDTYVIIISDIHGQLDELIDNHMSISPVDVDWSHVADVQRIRALLQEVINFAFKQEE